MIRELSDCSPVRAQAILDWPTRETLLAYVERLKRAALEEYRHATLVWAQLAPHTKKERKPPRLPSILLPEHRRRRGRPDG
jgi:hypothetical protein